VADSEGVVVGVGATICTTKFAAAVAAGASSLWLSTGATCGSVALSFSTGSCASSAGAVFAALSGLCATGGG
jgi:hypothetical protein